MNKYQYCLNNPLRYVDPDGHDPDDGDNGVVSGAVSFLKGVAQGAANVVVGTANLVKDAVVGCASCLANTVVDQAKSIGSTLKSDFDLATHPSQAATAISSAIKEGGSDNALNIVGNATGQVLASAAIAKGVKALGGAATGESRLAAPTSRVQTIFDTIQKEGIQVNINPKSAATAQEGNVTLSAGGNTRVNIRVETHPLKPNGPPVRHANVEVIRTVRGKHRKVENTHITQ